MVINFACVNDKSINFVIDFCIECGVVIVLFWVLMVKSVVELGYKRIMIGKKWWLGFKMR